MLTIEERRRRLGISIPTIEIPLKMTHVPTVYGYIRVSTDKQECSGLGLDVQEEQIKIKCKLLQLSDPIIVSDPALSGRFMANRPKFVEMCAMLKNGDTVIAHCLSRLARNTKEFLIFVEDMRTRCVRIICIKEDFDLKYENGQLSANAQLTLTLMAAIAEFEATQTRERTKAAMAKLRAEGRLRSKPFFGYQWITEKVTTGGIDGKKEVKQRTLVEVPEEQAVINFLLVSINDDKNISIADLTRLLNQKISSGSLQYRGKPKVFDNQVSRITNNNKLRSI